MHLSPAAPILIACRNSYAICGHWPPGTPAVSISRTISDPALSNEFLATTRAGVKARLGLTDAALAGEITETTQ